MKTLYLSSGEVNFLVNNIGNLWTWPPESSQWARAIIPVDEQDGNLGPFFRIKLLAADRKLREKQAAGIDINQRDKEGNVVVAVPLDCTVQELWLIDGLLNQVVVDPLAAQGTKMHSGDTFRSFATKVWDALVESHENLLADHLKPKEMPSGSPNYRAEDSAGNSTEYSASSIADAVDAAIRGANDQTVHRPGHSEDTG